MGGVSQVGNSCIKSVKSKYGRKWARVNHVHGVSNTHYGEDLMRNSIIKNRNKLILSEAEVIVRGAVHRLHGEQDNQNTRRIREFEGELKELLTGPEPHDQAEIKAFRV